MWRVFHVNVGISGLIRFRSTVLRCGILSLTVTKMSQTMPTRQGSRPERDTVGLRSPHTIANRSSGDTRQMLRRATAMASCAGVRVVRRQWGLCGYDPEHVAFAPFPDSLLRRSVAFCHDPRRLITRLNGRWYLWCRCRSAMTSNKHWCRPSEYAHSTDLARKSAERRGPI